MASLAEMMFQAASQSAQTPSGMSDAFAKGASLALQKQQLDQAKQQNQQAMQAAQSAKMEKFIDALQKGSNYEGQARSNYYNKWLPTYRDSLGLTEAFPNDSLRFVTATPDNMARLNTIIAQVRDPKNPLSEAEAISLIRDPSKFADVPPEVIDDVTNKLAESAKTKIGAQAQMATLEAAQVRETNNNRIQLTNKINELGIPGIRSDLDRVDSLIDGGLANWKPGTPVPGVTGADAKLPINVLKGDALKMRQAAQGVANQILKLRSGGAVSDGEATRLLSEIGMTAAVGEGGGWSTVFKGSPTAETFVTGMRGVQDKIGSLESSLRAGYGAGVYDQVGGKPMRSGQSNQRPQRQAPAAQSTPQAGTPPAVQTASGKTVTVDAKKAQQLIGYIGSDLSKAEEVEARYGMTLRQLKALLAPQGGQ